MDMSDSSSSSEDESGLSQKVRELETTLSDSPYFYNGHVEVIKLLRQHGDLEKAREARSNMRKNFPLTEKLWLEWINDEIPLTGLFAESALALRLLFESAVEDYLSVNIWIEYVCFAVEKMSVMPEGIAFPREVFEQAVIACGLHVSQSGQIWDAYLEFEKSTLQFLQERQVANADDEELKGKVEAQFERVEKLYRRRLAVTHIGMEEAFKEYQTTFSETAITEEGMPAYARARKRLEEYLPFEKQLATSDPPSLEDYRAYVDHLISSKAELSLVNTLYQRAVSHHCLDPQLWRDYLKFLDKHFRTASAVLLPGYRQAVRNCPWVIQFWLGLVRGLERTNQSHEEIIITFEKALVDNLFSSADHLAIWTAYCDYYRRLVGAESSHHSHQELTALIKRARSKLTKDFGNEGDPEDSLSRYHANVEKGVAEGRVIWEDIMTRHGKEADYWLDYITYVRVREGVESCRKLFRLAVNSVVDDPQRVCEGFLQFEREHGTLESFEGALTRTATQIERIGERYAKAAEKEALLKEDAKKKRKLDKKSQKKGHTENQNQPASSRKQQGGQGGNMRLKGSNPGLHQGSVGSQRSNAKSQGSNVKSQGSNPRKRPAVHAFFKDSDEEEDPSAKKPKVEGGDVDDAAAEGDDGDPKLKVSKGEGVAPAVAMETEQVSGKDPEGSQEERTVFVSNLPPKVTQDQLKEKFSECGEVLDVRLVHSRRQNRTNTFAYIEFTSPSPLSHALLLDRSLFLEQHIYVSPFKEKGEKYIPANIKNVNRMSKSTVFVNSIQKDIRQEELEELFKQCGEVKETRLVKDAFGRSKGYAFIEYVAESSAQEAVLKLDSHMMGLKRIGVAISNPPAAKKEEGASGGVAKDGAFAKPTFIPRRALQQQSDDAPLVGSRRKSNISLMPRVLAKRGRAGEVTPDAPAMKLSNDDFRKLLSKE